MKSIGRMTLVRLATLAALAACLSTGLAQAQSAAGKFTLPFEAHWGAVTLPAGHYTFTLNRPGSGSMVIVSRGTRAVAIILDEGYDLAASGKSELIVKREGNVNTVCDLRLPELGMVFYYAPVQPKRGSKAAEEEATLRIPVFAAPK